MVKINIGIVTVWADSGAGFVSKSYFNALNTQFDVKIYCRGTYIYDNNLPVWKLGDVTIDKSADNCTSINKKKFVNWISKNKISIILFNEQRYWRPILWAKELGVKCISYVDYYTSQTVPFFQIFDGLICNTKRHYSIFNQYENTIFIPWGTDPNMYESKFMNEKIRQVKFLHSAGLSGPNDRKGTINVILAFANTIGDSLLYIDSQLPLTYFDLKIQNLVNNDSRIYFRHITTVPPHNYKDAHVYVYPTRLEGIGLTIAEALMSGLPVITSNNPPMNEIVIDNYNGKLINIVNYISRQDGYYWPEVVIDNNHLTKIIQYYIDNPSIISEHSFNARNYSEKELNWQINHLILNQFFLNIFSHQNRDIPKDLKMKILNYDRMNNPNWLELISFGFKKLVKKVIN